MKSATAFRAFPELIKNIRLSSHTISITYAAIIPALKAIGAFMLKLGLDSGSNTTLQHMKGPGDSVQKNLKALRQAKSMEYTSKDHLCSGLMQRRARHWMMLSPGPIMGYRRPHSGPLYM
jgi:hypothetical protein